MTHKVLACDHIHPDGIRVLQTVAQVDVSGPLTESELISVIGNYDAILIRSQTKITDHVVENAPRLKVIARAGVGVDNIDVPAATRQGILVVNSPTGNTIAAAEHTLAMMLALSRYLPAADRSLKAGQWQRNDFVGSELYRKCLGIVGLGQIGSHVAHVARSLGMRVIAYDPFVTQERAQHMEVELCELETLFRTADIITLHVPKTSETNYMINRETLALMSTGVRIINCARGGLIDEAALAEAIQSGKVAGAAIDTFENEPLAQSPLQGFDRQVILTPHLGASTEEAQINVAIDVAEQVRDILKGEPARSAINIPSMKPHLLLEVQHHFKLMEKLGRFLSQLLQGAMKSIEISYYGELKDKQTEPLKVAALHGLLSPILKEGVNYVNALVLAEERGIEIQESKHSESHDYTNLLVLKVVSEKETRSVAGTMIGNHEERIVQINGLPISCIPSGLLLVIPHPDRPGMVGSIGKLLGDNHINISGIQLGRHAVRGEAVMVVNIDDSLSHDLLNTIRIQKEFQHTRLIDLT